MLNAFTDPTYGRRNRITALLMGTLPFAWFVAAWLAWGFDTAVVVGTVALAVCVGGPLVAFTLIGLSAPGATGYCATYLRVSTVLDMEREARRKVRERFR